MDPYAAVVALAASTVALYESIMRLSSSVYMRRRNRSAPKGALIQALRDPGSHRLDVEQAFQELTGKNGSEEEIRVLAEIPNFFKALKERYDGSRVIDFYYPENRYYWVGVYGYQWIRKSADKFYFLWYFIAALLALFPIYFKGFSVMAETPVALFSASLMVLAIAFLMEVRSVKSARRFMERLEAQKVLGPADEVSE